MAIVLIALLVPTTWRVYAVRDRLGREDADPVLLARIQEGLRLPYEIGDGKYRGADHEIDAAIIEGAGADVYGSVRYQDAQGHAFRVYIGGAIGNQENFHAPSYCLPAAGWEVQANGVIPIVGSSAGEHGATMRRLFLQQGREKMLVYYWFQAGDRIADHEWAIRWYRFLDLLVDKAFRPTMIVTIYVPVTDAVAAAEERAMQFLRTMGPHIDRALLPAELSE